MDDSAGPQRPMDEADLDTSFLSGANATFIAEMNDAWRRDPRSVDASWAKYFESLAAIGEEVSSDDGPSWGKAPSRVVGAIDPEESIKAVAAGLVSGRRLNARDIRAATLDSLRAVMLIRAYRIRGHLLANLDPLSLEEKPLHP